MTDKDLQELELTEESINLLIYEIRGQKVMLDFDLARIYGYSTKGFNQQVRNNIEKFDDDFMFQLTGDEAKTILMSKKLTSSWGGTRKLPYVFTEQGIYMLMTVLRGELAVKQSKALIRLFKQMKDYIVENNYLLSNASLINEKFSSYDKRFEVIENKIEQVMDNFIDPSTYKHYLILNGQKIEADIAYQQIFSPAKESVYIVDDYISIKTLQHLKVCTKGVRIIIFSDNAARKKLTDMEIDDFKEDTGLALEIKPTLRKFHDRFILIDYKKDCEKIYYSGSSVKDAGKGVTIISQVSNSESYHILFDSIIKF